MDLAKTDFTIPTLRRLYIEGATTVAAPSR